MIKYELEEIRPNVFKHCININGFSLNISNMLTRFERDYLKYVSLETNEVLAVGIENRKYNDEFYQAIFIENLKTHLKMTLNLGSFKYRVQSALEEEMAERIIYEIEKDN